MHYRLTKYKTGTISIKDKNIRIGYVPQFSNLDGFPITLVEVVLSGMINQS